MAKQRIQNFQPICIAAQLAEDLDLRHGPASGQLHRQGTVRGIDRLGTLKIPNRRKRQSLVVKRKALKPRLLGQSVKPGNRCGHIPCPKCRPCKHKAINQRANAAIILDARDNGVKLAFGRVIRHKRHIGQLTFDALKPI